MSNPEDFGPSRRQPIFNLPPVIVACVAVLTGIHLARVGLLDAEADFELLLRFAFIPLRVIEPETIGEAIPGGPWAAWWSFVTYALFHADWAHLLFNGLWLAAFGAPLAWRFGATRFLLFSAVGAIAGALVYLLANSGEIQPMIGASAAISAHMAGASRFVFSAGGPLRGSAGAGAYRPPAAAAQRPGESRFVFSAGGPLRGSAGAAAYRRPAAPLGEVIRDRRVLAFL